VAWRLRPVLRGPSPCARPCARAAPAARPGPVARRRRARPGRLRQPDRLRRGTGQRHRQGPVRRRRAGDPARAGAVTAADLTGRALFIVSTTGEGDAPDPARAFIRDVMKDGVQPLGPALRRAGPGGLDLRPFCAFGRSLDAWLAHSRRRAAVRPGRGRRRRPGRPAPLAGQLSVLTGVTDAPTGAVPPTAAGPWPSAPCSTPAAPAARPGHPPGGPLTARPGKPATSWRSARATTRPRSRRWACQSPRPFDLPSLPTSPPRSKRCAAARPHRPSPSA
jgi:hypothetical protein